MRQIILSLIFVLFLFSSCSNNSPKDTAEKYYSALSSQNYEEINSIINMRDIPEQVKHDLQNFIKEQNEKKIHLNGNIKSIQVQSENVSSDGTKAKVVSLLIYEKGDTLEQALNFVSIDGQWFLDAKY